MDSDTRRDEASLIARLQKLHNAEVTHLKAEKAARDTTFFNMLRQYMLYLVVTWGNVFRRTMFLSLNPIDLVAVLAFAFGCSIILGVMLLICAMLKFLPTQAIIAACIRAANKYGLNLKDPMRIYRSITQPEVDVAGAALARPPMAPERQGERIFDIDVARLLLQFSALMYERETEPVFATPSAAGKSPGHYADTGGIAENAKHDGNDDSVQEDPIRDFCRTFGLDYAPVSELNASDSAYAALFWNPKSCWIVVAFKGTSPAEYAEWVSDFNYELVDAGDWLPGFSQGGFLQRVFPEDVSQTGGIRPWDTITTGIKLVARSLRESQSPNTKINLFFTGHSLGCATGSLAYARAVLVDNDLGDDVILRDGYLFAAPIICDAASVRAFDGAINRNYNIPITLWRVTNMKDFVATGLPDFGDKKGSRFMRNSLLNFAHLGAEIRMRNKPMPSVVAGWPHITRGLPVVTTSSLSADLVGTVGKTQSLSPSMLFLESLPFFGRFFQHAPSFYWDQLQRVGVGLCQWVKDS